MAAVNRETLARHEFDKQQGEANLAGQRLTTYNTLKREVETNKNIYDGLLQKLREAASSSGMTPSGIQIIDPAKPPQRPQRPKVFLNLALGALLGMVFGVAVAFTMERSDRSIKSPEEVERFLCLPPLGSVPAVNSLNSKMYALPALETSELPGWKSSDQKRAGEGPLGNGLRPGDSQAAVALGEAFRSLCASVLFSSTGPAPRSILIASAEPREGKTTVASNLAIALAELGNRVLIVDADMRRPKLHKLFEVSGVSSLASYLAGERPWRAMAQPTRIEGLDALFCGAIPLNPVELLSTERLRKLLDEAKREYKYVIIDSPRC